ncbi:SNF2 family N-terminal domain-domain-containing protein [Protomyces lactucae-debilis]|uniref:SNF2 family N-terminal domain-domain-containing protein n=1 Tax=Protomyces lactucae-debilis TaxID=2754530 RepID=A0A1Y2FNA3_PROLT|nr:SNF2 family N-terminal domain-containing protein [Protomyces lactucae-debilis]ORY85471.1 SNF2 family N-terminal domain-domain-containing protein [Protomyces lactucae-debilis]
MNGVSAVLPFEIILYGDGSKTERVGVILSQKNCFLVTPVAYDHSFVYVNPHQTAKRSFKPANGALQYGTSLFKTAEEIKEEIQGLFYRIQNSENLVLTACPAGVKTPLLKHQAQALTFCIDHEKEASRDSSLEHSLWRPGLKDGKTYWKNAITPQVLYRQPKECRGGLLADEMGLGKTLSMLSLIAHSKEDAKVFARARLANESVTRTQATLIVCPLSVLSNWTEQVKLHMSSTPKIVVHHQKTRTFDPKEMQAADIVLTTYALLAQEFKAAEEGNRETILPQMEWYRVILDEAHIIKDISTQQSQAAAALSALNRWAVTATPVQNGLNDLSALFNFLKLEPFDQRAVWSQYISQPMKQGDQVAVTRLQTLLKMRCLRRTKDYSSDGKPSEALMQMAPKTEETRLLKLDDEEQEIYNTHLAYYQRKTRGLGKAQTTINVLHCINRLRQICLHTGILATLDAKEAETSAGKNESASDDRTCDFCGEELVTAAQKDGQSAYCNTGRCNHHFCSEDGQALLDEEAADCPRKKDLAIPYSTKLKALLTDLGAMLDDAEGEDVSKAIVFSQFTSFLDLCGEALSGLGIPFARLDGSLSRDERTAQLARLERDASADGVRVMLVSTRAGGVGLNLVAANRVFFMEPCWNPSIYAQAVDRCHRIGQRKQVAVVSYVVEGSIEQTMIKLQSQKRQLADLSLAKNLSQESVLAKSLLSLKTLIK